MRWLALLLLPACAPGVVNDLTKSPEARCAEARSVYSELEPSLRNDALVIAACAQVSMR
jgi:hypothetical protein